MPYWRAEKVDRRRVAEGADHPIAPDGGERAADPHRLCGGAAPSGVYLDGAGVQPEARFRRHVELGRGIQGEER